MNTEQKEKEAEFEGERAKETLRRERKGIREEKSGERKREKEENG